MLVIFTYTCTVTIYYTRSTLQPCVVRCCEAQRRLYIFDMLDYITLYLELGPLYLDNGRASFMDSRRHPFHVLILMADSSGSVDYLVNADDVVIWDFTQL